MPVLLQGLASAEASSSSAANELRVGSRMLTAPQKASEGRSGALLHMAAKATRGRPESRMLASSSSTGLALQRNFRPTIAVDEARQRGRGYENNALRGSNRYDLSALRRSSDYEFEASSHRDGLFDAAMHLQDGEARSLYSVLGVQKGSG